MKVQHLSTVKDFFGVHEVTVLVEGKKEYTFPLKSGYDVDEFLKQLRVHPGKALNYLKKVRINNGY